MKYDYVLGTDVAASAPPFNKPSAGKKPHAFFLCSVRYGREVSELVQRMDCTWKSITYDRSWDMNKWGFGDFYDARGGIWDFAIVLQNLEEALTSDEHFDVLVLPSINGWGEFTPATRKAILRRVHEGAGLVLLQPFDGKNHEKTPELASLSPLQAKYQEGFDARGYADVAFDTMESGQWLPAAHPITNGIPFATLPCTSLAYYPYEATGEVILKSDAGHPIAAVHTQGKGRVAAFGYYPRDILPQSKDFIGKDACFNPIIDTWHGAITATDFPFLEYFYRLIARAILWSANALPTDGIQGCSAQNNTLTPKAGAGSLTLTLKNSFDAILLENEPIQNEQAFALPPCASEAGGSFRAEFTLQNASGIIDFHTHAFTLPAAITLQEVTLTPDVAKEGDALTARVCTSSASADVVLRLIDGYGRELACRTLQGSSEYTESFTVPNALSIHIYIEATLLVNGYAASRCRSQNAVITPSQRTLKDFEVFMNPQNRGHGDLLTYVNSLYPQIGMTGTFVGDNRLVAMSGGKGLGVYWYDRAPYVERKEQYLRTKDKKYLTRSPCLNSADFWEENRASIHENVSAYKKYGPIAYFAQDEGSLTCYTDELDLCFCPLCMEKMQGWLQTEYESLNALNTTWKSSYKSWSEAIPLTKEEARQTQNYPPWADHRRFMELTYASAYQNFSQMIKDVDPEGRVRMSGCQASTAYSGNDYDLLHQHVKYFEAYPVGNQYEFHRSFRQQDTILGGWFGYGADGTSVKKRIWHAMYHGLTLISIFWEYACLNPDFSFSKSARDMGEAFREIRREGIGKLLLHTAIQSTLGVAVHYSMASVHATTITGRRGDFEQNRQGWLEVLEDMGYQYRFVSSRQIEEGELQNGIKMLILPYSVAVSPAEAEAMRAFVSAGGLLIGDVQTGLMDNHCATSSTGALDNLFGIRRLTTDFEPFYVCEGFTVNPEFKYFNYQLKHTPGKEEIGPGVQIAEMGTRAEGGISAYVDGFMGKAASVVVNPQGDGKAVYLNFCMKDYPTLRRGPGGGEGVRDILHHVFALSSIQKPAQVFADNGALFEQGVESFYYTLGDSSFLCLQKDLNEQVEVNYDGLTLNKEGGAALAVHPIRIQLPKKSHVYSIRTKRYMGFTSSFQDTITEGDTALYSLLPYKAKALALDAPTTLIQGQSATITLTLSTDEGGAGEGVFALSVHAPNGEYSPLYSRNLHALNGRCTLDIPFALNDTPGSWQILAKDVATGTTAKAIITLQSKQ